MAKHNWVQSLRPGDKVFVLFKNQYCMISNTSTKSIRLESGEKLSKSSAGVTFFNSVISYNLTLC